MTGRELLSCVQGSSLCAGARSGCHHGKDKDLADKPTHSRQNLLPFVLVYAIMSVCSGPTCAQVSVTCCPELYQSAILLPEMILANVMKLTVNA